MATTARGFASRRMLLQVHSISLNARNGVTDRYVYPWPSCLGSDLDV